MERLEFVGAGTLVGPVRAGQGQGTSRDYLEISRQAWLDFAGEFKHFCSRTQVETGER